MKSYFVYIITNESNRVFYTGITSNLSGRIYNHKNKTYDGFSAKYNLNKLVYFEDTSDVNFAIEREKKLKKCPRIYKISLINKFNPEWKDLFDDII